MLRRLEKRSLPAAHFVNGIQGKIWTGAMTSQKYGVVYFKGRKYLVHRVSAWISLDFDLNSELCICHKCDVPLCWEPSHLFVGSNMDNYLDSCKKGRAALYPKGWEL